VGLAVRRRAGLLASGKPTDNAFAEGFNSRVRQECLNAFWFLSLADALDLPPGNALDRD